jgi:hypothetical protein
LCLYEARGVNSQCAKGINLTYAFKFKIRNFSDNVVFLLKFKCIGKIDTLSTLAIYSPGFVQAQLIPLAHWLFTPLASYRHNYTASVLRVSIVPVRSQGSKQPVC